MKNKKKIKQKKIKKRKNTQKINKFVVCELVLDF